MVQVRMVGFGAETSPDVLYVKEPGDVNPWPVYLQLNLETGEYAVAAMPERRWSVASTVLRFVVPLVHAQGANVLLTSTASDAQRILDGTTLAWNGYREEPAFSPDAVAAQEELVRYVHEVAQTLLLHTWTLDEVLPLDEIMREYEITAELSDAQLVERGEKILKDLRYRQMQPIAVIVDLMPALIECRDALRQDLRAELVKASELLAEATARRDLLIRRLATWTKDADRRIESDRAIGDLANLSHTAVQRIRKSAAVR